MKKVTKIPIAIGASLTKTLQSRWLSGYLLEAKMYELALAHTSQELRTAYIFTLLRRKSYARTS